MAELSSPDREQRGFPPAEKPPRPHTTPVVLSICGTLCLCLFMLTLWTLWVPVIRQGTGLLNAKGSPVGGDFAIFFVASSLTLAEGGRKVFDEAAYQQKCRQVVGAKFNYQWIYPPSFLLMVAPLALFPYLVALAVWLITTLAVYILVMSRIVPGSLGILLSLAFPAVFLNILDGQNGFLSASLFGAGLLALERRPLLAGLILGCLSFKPHLAVLLPVALVAGRCWWAFLGASLSLMGWMVASALAFGSTIWPEFLNTLLRATSLLEQVYVWEKMGSVYAGARMAGLGQVESWFLQGSATVTAAAGVTWLWCTGSQRSLRYAALSLGSLLATPYVFYYDLTLLALPLAWLAVEGMETGWHAGEKVVLGLGWVAPLTAYPFKSLLGGLPLTPLIILTLFLFTLRRHYSQIQGAEVRVDT